MICASCGVASTAVEGDACPDCGQVPLLDGRYRLDAVLGGGGSRATYRATRLADALPVCVKQLAYRRLEGFEADKLFRREAVVLAQLDHPAIPAYIEDFTLSAGRLVSLYLVQELVRGPSLADEMKQHRHSEDEVLAVVAELCPILEYLHGQTPPVIHRDLKPANIIRSDRGLVLVDFGSVRAALSSASEAGSTVTGTLGYMAPEQLYGAASPASDLYGLGATALALLSQRDPSELLTPAGALDWRPAVLVKPATEDLLSALLAAEPVARPSSAARVRLAAERARQGIIDAALTRSIPEPIEPAQPSFPGRRREASWLFGAAGVAVVIVPLVVGLVLAQSHARDGSPSVQDGLAAGSPPAGRQARGNLSRQHLPRDVAGVTLGMAPGAVATLLGAEGRFTELATAEVRGTAEWGPRARSCYSFRESLPGVHALAWLDVGGQSAPCELWFAVEDALSKIQCLVLETGTGQNATAFGRELAADYQARYGRSTDERETDGGTRIWRWHDAGVGVQIEAGFPASLLPRSVMVHLPADAAFANRVTLTLATTAQMALEWRLQAEADAECAAAPPSH